MIEGLLDWLSGQPPVAIYLVLGLLAAVENFFPPFPADTAIALGAFLAHRDITNPWLVYAATFVGSTGGALLMYELAARHSGALLRSRIGRLVMPPRAVRRVRKNYLRYGVAVLFLGRLLPGFRAVVGPFAGLMRVGFVKALLPIALGSAVWYGAIVFIASQLGHRIGEIIEAIDGMNRGLGITSLLVLLVGAYLVVRAIRRRRALQELSEEEEEPA
jgi:membrane protein DedA with SNARE-associated domain